MSNDKYEYLLHTWGGFYNKKYADIHKEKPGYFFFNTAAERNLELNRLQLIEKQLDAHHLAHILYEGTFVRYNTVAKMIFVYNSKKYPYEYDFGYGADTDSAKYMFNDGNYACDCNRSLFLKRNGVEIQELECGHTIEMIDFKVERIKGYTPASR